MNSLRELRARLLGADLARLGFRPDDAADFRDLAMGLDSHPGMAASVESVSQKICVP